MDEAITISLLEYSQLLEDRDFLYALQQAGVDNWEGYSYACRIAEGEDPDDLF